MSRTRLIVGAAGGLFLAFGVVQLLVQVPLSNLLGLAFWLVAAVVIHDGVVAPLTVAVGTGLTRIPARARRYVQGGLIVAAIVTVIAAPLIYLRGSQPTAKAILQRNYGANLALLLGLIAAVAVARYAIRIVQDRRSPVSGPERAAESD